MEETRIGPIIDKLIILEEIKEKIYDMPLLLPREKIIAKRLMNEVLKLQCEVKNDEYDEFLDTYTGNVNYGYFKK